MQLIRLLVQFPVLLMCIAGIHASEPINGVGNPHPRLIYNDDATNFLMSGDDLTVADLRAYLGRLQGTQVDLVAYDVALGGYNTDFQPAMELWRKLPGKRISIHAYVNCGPGTAMYHSLEQYRAAAANAYGAGADGVYLFNFPCLDELSRLLPRPVDQPAFPSVDFHAQCWHPDLAKSRQALLELGDGAGLARKDKHYLFYTGSSPAYRHYTQDVASIDRAAPQSTRLSFRCYDAADTKGVALKLKTVGVTTRERFGFSLNGNPVPPDRIQRLHAPDGRDPRIHSIPLQPYSQFVFKLEPGMLLRGDNQLTVSLDEKEPNVTGKIDLVEMELLLAY